MIDARRARTSIDWWDRGTRDTEAAWRSTSTFHRRRAIRAEWRLTVIETRDRAVTRSPRTSRFFESRRSDGSCEIIVRINDRVQKFSSLVRILRESARRPFYASAELDNLSEKSALVTIVRERFVLNEQIGESLLPDRTWQRCCGEWRFDARVSLGGNSPERVVQIALIAN